jgi:hypothetical protein
LRRYESLPVEFNREDVQVWRVNDGVSHVQFVTPNGQEERMCHGQVTLIKDFGRIASGLISQHVN